MAGRKLTPEEARAWARVAQTVKPIGPPVSDLAEFVEALEEGEPVRRKGTSSSVPIRPTPNAPRLKQQSPSTPANRKHEKRVRRGRLELHGQFDLHGHTQVTADAALPQWLMRCQAEGARCVLVITGKGRSGEGVLRRNFLHWLESAPARALISGYSEAHARHGGAGAFYVFLRKPC